MRLHLTKHAREAFKTRIGCSPLKYMKLTAKAWNSREPIEDGDIANYRHYSDGDKYSGKHSEYRKLMGRIFLFRTYGDNAWLVTLYPSCKRLSKRKGRILAQHK